MLQHSDTTYRLFAVTCHRGTDLRYGHYTSYVKAPNGKWYHADDVDMTPISLSDVLGDRNAYLLSYIRVDDGVMPPKQPVIETPVRNGDASTSKVNGHSNGYRPTSSTNGTAHGRAPVSESYRQSKSPGQAETRSVTRQYHDSPYL